MFSSPTSKEVEEINDIDFWRKKSTQPIKQRSPVKTKQPRNWVIPKSLFNKSNNTIPTSNSIPTDNTTSSKEIFKPNNIIVNKSPKPSQLTTESITSKQILKIEKTIDNRYRSFSSIFPNKENEQVKNENIPKQLENDNLNHDKMDVYAIPTTDTSTIESSSPSLNTSDNLSAPNTLSIELNLNISTEDIDIDIDNNNTTQEIEIDYDEVSKPKPPRRKSENEIAKLKKTTSTDNAIIKSDKTKKPNKLPLPAMGTINETPKKRSVSDGGSPLSSSSTKKDKRFKKDNNNNVTNEYISPIKETATVISKVLPQTLKLNQMYQDEAKQIIKSLKSPNNLKSLLDTLSQLSQILTDNENEFSKILRSKNLLQPILNCLMNLSNYVITNSNITKSKSQSSIKRSNTTDLSDLSTNNNLYSLFLESSNNSSSQTSTNNIIDDDSSQPLFINKRSKSNNLSKISPLKSFDTINNITSPGGKGDQYSFSFEENEKRAIILSSCFIFYVFSRNQVNSEHFSKSIIEWITCRSMEIPDNYILEFFTTPSKLPKSPKSPKSPSSAQRNSRSLKPIELEINISNHFQGIVGDTSRFSITPASLSLATLANLSCKHISQSMKLKLCEYGIVDSMTTLLEKYIIYLNPLLDISSISPKLIGNIEFILKILDECLMGDTKIIRERFINYDSLNLLITFIRYLNIIISHNNDRLAGIDIKLIGSEAIISLLKILLNITHENSNSCKLIGNMDKAYKDNLELKNCNNKSEIEFKEYFIDLNSNNNNNNLQQSNTTPTKNSSLTPRKVKFLESIKITKDFGFRTIVNLLRLDVPEKFDISQLVISLLVNLMECNPENREIFRSINGSIECIMQLYLARTCPEKIITRFTSKTQEKIASSYLVLLIGFLIKDNVVNRKYVLDLLPSHSFDDMVILLEDFIKFQSSNFILSTDIYQLCMHLIQDIFLSTQYSDSSFSNEINEQYKKFKEDFDKDIFEQQEKQSIESIRQEVSSK